MNVCSLMFWMIFPLSSSVFSYDDFAQIEGCCTYKGPDLENIEYTIKNHYNEKLMMEYNSTRGNWTGFTAFAIAVVKYWNNDPYDAIQRLVEMKLLCTDPKGRVQAAGDFAVAPTIKLNSVQLSSSRHPAMLVCTAYNFYPKQIQVTWLRNGQEVTSGVSCSEVLSDGNWYYQIHSYLEYTPAPHEEITCMVEHPSLSKPALHVWDPSLPVPERIKVVVGLVGLVLGFVICSSGFIYYKKKSAAYVAVCRGQVSVDVEDLTAAEST